MTRFKYDVVHLISAVRERPCLWDKSLEIYKDRVERRSAWEEIFTILDLEYHNLSLEQQRSVGEHILAKWTNIRDTFLKSLKHKNGKPRKKYIYYDNLKFLHKILPVEEIEYTEELPTQEDDVTIEYVKHEPDPEEPAPTSRKRSKKHNNYEENYTSTKKAGNSSKILDSDSNSANDIGFIEFDETDSSKMNDPRLMNEDEAFFASLLPTVVRYDEDERLEFRIAVLTIMKQIKDKKGWSIE